MSPRALLLDVGNTLIYERPSRAAIYASEARSRGAEVTDEAMGGHMARAHRELPRVVEGHYRYSDAWFGHFIERIFGRYLGLAPEALAGAVDALFARFENPATFHVFPGAVELVTWARREGLVVGVVSNWSSRLPKLLDGLGLAEHLDFLVCSAIERTEKPERRIFELALSNAGVEAREALHAGDHPVRDGAAVNLGIEVVLVDHFGSLGPTPLPKVGDLMALREWVEGRLL